MAYNVNFTDSINKNPIVVDDNSSNTVDSSLTFIGRNTASYGQAFSENFLHVLENFANNKPDCQIIFVDTPGLFEPKKH